MTKPPDLESTLFVVGDGAGPRGLSGRIGEMLSATEGIAWRAGESPGAIRAIAREAAQNGARTIVAVGGDGTLSAVVNGAASHLADVEIGLLPAGTGNDFARALGFDLDPDRTLHAFLEGRTTTACVDLLEVETSEEAHLATNGCNGGLGAQVADRTSSDLKDWLGSFAYALSVGEALFEMERHQLRVEADGERIEAEVVQFLVMNGSSVGGGLRVAPAADPTDGRLDLTLVPALDPLRLSGIVAALAAGRIDEQDDVIHRRVREVTIEADPPARFSSDGDPAGATPATFRVRPRALRFLRPG